jgi:hypothetical protein
MDSTDDSPASEAARGREFTDILVSSPEVAASIPSPEEMRWMVVAWIQARRSRGRRELILFGFFVLFIALAFLNVFSEWYFDQCIH